MRILLFFFFVSTFYCFSQTELKEFEFKFFKNGLYRNLKNIELKVIKDSDTINCNILNRKIMIPTMISSSEVLINVKKKQYKIKKVDFTKLSVGSIIIFGIENNLKNYFLAENPDTYAHKYAISAFKKSDIDEIKKVIFLTFNMHPESVTNNKFLFYCEFETK